MRYTCPQSTCGRMLWSPTARFQPCISAHNPDKTDSFHIAQKLLRHDLPARLLSVVTKSLIGCCSRDLVPLVSTVANTKSTFAASEFSVLSASGSLCRLVWISHWLLSDEAQCTLLSGSQHCCQGHCAANCAYVNVAGPCTGLSLRDRPAGQGEQVLLPSERPPHLPNLDQIAAQHGLVATVHMCRGLPEQGLSANACRA